MLYAATAVAAIAYLVWIVAPVHGSTNIFVSLAICSLAGSLSVVSCKVVTVTAPHCVVGGHGWRGGVALHPDGLGTGEHALRLDPLAALWLQQVEGCVAQQRPPAVRLQKPMGAKPPSCLSLSPSPSLLHRSGSGNRAQAHVPGRQSVGVP
jgi:hypothetical protein